MQKPPLPDKTQELVKNLVKFISDTDKMFQINFGITTPPVVDEGKEIYYGNLE